MQSVTKLRKNVPNVLLLGLLAQLEGPDHRKNGRLLFRPTLCEAKPETPPPSSAKVSTEAPYPSWTRRTLAAISLASLPLPRIIVKNDPDLSLTRRQQRERQRDERAVHKLQQQFALAASNGDRKAAGEALKAVFEIMYGKGIRPQDRQDFLARYGCTGWTEDVIVHLLNLAENRGFVEIGAGNGQWSRVLTDRYNQSDAKKQQKKKFDFVLAYDDMSQLPLNPEIYHERTQPNHDYFFKVQECDTPEAVLQQWACRGRVLLLVFPPPDSDMAFRTVKAYAETSPLNDTIVYVGEGRGGASANDEFFDYLESGDWVLCKMLKVLTFGKGYEKLFILKRRTR